METMIDEIFDRQYQAGREHLHSGIDRLAARTASALADTFAAMKRIQFDAPWTAKTKVGSC